MGQDVVAMDLVVEQIEAVRRFRLRLAIQLPLKGPDAHWCCQAHRQSPILVFVRSAPEVRALPSAGITRPQQYYDPVRPPPGPPPFATLRAQPPTRCGYPPITRITLPACRAHLPRRIATGARVGCFPVARGLPRFSAGSASATSLSGPAQASLTLRPVGLLNRPRRPLSQGFSPAGYPAKPLASYQIKPTTIWVEPSFTGDPRHRGALRNPG